MRENAKTRLINLDSEKHRFYLKSHIIGHSWTMEYRSAAGSDTPAYSFVEDLRVGFIDDAPPRDTNRVKNSSKSPSFKTKTPGSVQSSKERKGQTERQNWRKQAIDSQDVPKDHFAILCGYPGCPSISLVRRDFKKSGLYFCAEHYRSGSDADCEEKASEPDPKVVDDFIERGHPRMSPALKESVAVERQDPMFSNADYVEKIIPCASSIPYKVELYTDLCGLLDVLHAWRQERLESIDGAFITGFQHLGLNMPSCFVLCPYVLGNLYNGEPCCSFAHFMCPVLNRCTPFVRCFGSMNPFSFGCLTNACRNLKDKCVSKCVFDEPCFEARHVAQPRHIRLRLGVSQSYLSQGNVYVARSGIVSTKVLPDLYDFCCTRFVSQRFGADDEIRRALREIADDYRGYSRIPIQERDIVVNDTLMSFVWHKRVLLNARSNVLGVGKPSPDHITMQ